MIALCSKVGATGKRETEGVTTTITTYVTSGIVVP
jgi:hypothetical protein